MSVSDAAGPSRPLTWAERLAGKTSTTPLNKPSPGTSFSKSPQRGHPSGLSTSIQPSRAPSATTASSTASIGGNSSMHSVASLSSQTTTAPASAASSLTGKSRVPTSTDSGWGEADSSLESGHSDLSQSFTTQSTSTVSDTAISQTASNTLESSKAPESLQGQTNAVKPPSGPPKVNIWQLRKEEAARKASELEKLKMKPADPQKQQAAAPTAPETQVDGDTKRQKGPSGAMSPAASKSNKKKRETNSQSASSHERQASSRTTIATGENVSQQSKPAATEKPGQRSGKQDGQSAGSATSWAANTRETAASEDSFNTNSTRRSPLQKANGAATIDHTSIATANEATIEGDISGKQDKKQTSKNAEAEGRASSSSRKQDSRKEIRANLQPSQHASVQTEAGVVASDSMSRNSSKRSNKGENVSDGTQAGPVVGQTMLDTGANVELASSELEDRTAALASTSTASSTSAQPLTSGDTASTPARASSSSMLPKSDTVRQAALPSSLPAKPIGAPTEPTTSLISPTYGYAGNKARLSPSGTNQTGTANAESRSQISPAGTTGQIEGNRKGTRSEAALSGRHASLGEGYAMARPPYDYSASQNGVYYPSIAPGQSYAGGGAGMQSSGGYGNGRGGKRGGMSSGRGRGGRNGNVYIPRNQASPNVGMYGTSSPPLGMGHQAIYPGVAPAGNIGTLPPNVFFDHNQAYQFDAYGNPTPAYYAAPSMYGQPGPLPPQPYYMGSPGPFAAPLPPPAFVQHQQSSTLPSSAASEASVGPRSQPGSPVPTALQIPPFQSMSAAGEAASRMNASGASTSSQSGQNKGQTSNHQGQQSNQTQATSAPFSPAPQRPTPIYDYSFIAFPPDGTAFWVLGQIEYYLSPDNLARDIFLRQSMFDEGWIEIGLIASFQRLSTLTKDIYLVRSMMETSFMCEVREMMVRPRDWRQWLLPGARKVVWQFPEPNMHLQQHAAPQGQPAPGPAQTLVPHQVPQQPIAAPPS